MNRVAKAVAVAALALVVAGVIAGCTSGTSSSGNVPTSGTAKAGLAVAQSALATMAPDAKLLLIQTATSAAPTASPVWAYLFGSPKSDKTYVVYVAKGKAMGASEYGNAGLSKTEWAAVPASDAWTVDSNDALAKAIAESKMTAPSSYNMGMVTYIPSTEASTTTKPLTWYVALKPPASGGTSATVAVDAKTGAIVPTKK